MSSQKFSRPLTVTERLNFQAIPDWLDEIAETMIGHGYRIFLVGGAVRDLLQGILPDDWDLATDATPDRVEELFSETYPSGKAYGTITIIKNGQPVEMTTLREDREYLDGRHPGTVLFTDDIIKDLRRRDFTVNAMAYSFADHLLIDPFHGQDDLSRHLLRAVGEPETRFREDGLRMFRFFRFLATCPFKAHRPTLKAITPDYAVQLSAERIRDELSKLLLGKWVRHGLTGLEKSGLLQKIIPELDVSSFSEGSGRYNLWEHLLRTTEAIRPELSLRWAALLHDIAKPLTVCQGPSGIHFYGHDESGAILAQSILTRLHYPAALIKNVTLLIRYHMFQLPLNATDAAIRRLIVKVGSVNMEALLELRRADIVATDTISFQSWEAWSALTDRIHNLITESPPLTTKKMAVNGHDLMESLNLQPGPQVGQLLSYLFTVVIDHPEKNNKEILLKLAQDYLQIKR